MKCCGYDMEFSLASDNPNKGWAFNLYVCEECGMVVKEDVWSKSPIKHIFCGEVVLSTDSESVDLSKVKN